MNSKWSPLPPIDFPLVATFSSSIKRRIAEAKLRFSKNFRVHSVLQVKQRSPKWSGRGALLSRARARFFASRVNAASRNFNRRENATDLCKFARCPPVWRVFTVGFAQPGYLYAWERTPSASIFPESVPILTVASGNCLFVSTAYARFSISAEFLARLWIIVRPSIHAIRVASNFVKD